MKLKMNIKHIIFLLIYTIASVASSSAVTSNELTDLEKNESQIEIPPLSSITTDNTPNISDVKNDDSSNTIVISENVNPLEQTEKSEIKHSVTDVEQQHDDEITIKSVDDTEEKPAESEESSKTSEDNKDITQENLTIPVFSEWTQMQQMQEAEKKLVELTNSSETNKDIKNETLAKSQIKMRQKNYASPDCGAKVLSANPEAQSTSSVLSDKDEYMLSPCTDRIWFIVELCDSIQAQRVELANFELFSSPLKSVSVSVSNRFPAREWTLAGHYDAKSERDIQSFELKDVALFGKFVRVDLQYTNTEHYCPLSFFRIYGTSEIEAFEVENEPDGTVNTIVDDDFIRTQSEDLKSNENNNKDNILNRAGAAVMSIVQKVLAKSNGNDEKPNNVSSARFVENCMSMSHNILCETCSDLERDHLHNFIGCKNEILSNFLVKNSDIKDHLVNSLACHGILGFDLKSENAETTKNFIISILPQRYIAAMCNMVAGDLKALSLRIENIPEINSNLIKKGDEVSLKNVSKKQEDCKNVEVTTTEVPVVVNEVDDGNNSTNNQTEIEKDANSQNASEINIFNNVDKFERVLDVEDVVIEKPIVVTDIPTVTETPTEVKEKIIENIPVEVKPPETSAELKINGDSGRSNNAPESVFLRLSNRIKTLEKNMTLSTQYLEELSRRYKKQIEDLQTSYNKLQSLFDNLNQNKKESEKRASEDKIAIRSILDGIDSRSQYMEIILIILSAFLLLQTILVIVLFKRLSILRTAVFTPLAQQPKLSLENEVIEVTAEKTRNGRKRSKQRVRKISAPNILTKGTKTNDLTPALPSTLSRTVSAPHEVCEMIEIKDKFPDIQQAPMLEENDDILIPGFEDLKISDDQEIKDVSERREYDDDGEDTASTASIKTDSHKSFNFRRRLSSPTFLKLKRSSMKKHATVNGETAAWRKAKSESPPKINNSFNLNEDESSLKIRKNNSFKKLLKKFF